MLIWLYLIVFIFALTFLYASWRAAPWLPMHANDIGRTMALAKLRPGDVFFDLGAGDGRILFAAAASGVKTKGFEISLLPYLLAQVKILFFRGSPKPKIYFRDFWNINLGEADAVFVFLLPRIMERLKAKMEKELKPGAKVICYTWAMPGWEPTAVDNLAGRQKLYLYSR